MSGENLLLWRNQIILCLDVADKKGLAWRMMKIMSGVPENHAGGRFARFHFRSGVQRGLSFLNCKEILDVDRLGKVEGEK